MSLMESSSMERGGAGQLGVASVALVVFGV